MSELSTRKGIGDWLRKRIVGVTHMVRRKVLARRFRHVPPRSILSFDCVGGVISHELHWPFLSPTVNLFFDSYDAFLDYLTHLSYYAAVGLEPCGFGDDGGHRYPIGVLPGNGTCPDVKIHFLHYPSFEEAEKKWRERSERIVFDRICVVMQVDRPERRLMERFAALPYDRKEVLTYAPFDAPFVFRLRSLDRFIPGRLLDDRGLLGRRFLDEFDYPAFLRDGTIRRRN